MDGTLCLSQDAFLNGTFLALKIATGPDNWTAIQAIHNAIIEGRAPERATEPDMKDPRREPGGCTGH